MGRNTYNQIRLSGKEIIKQLKIAEAAMIKVNNIVEKQSAFFPLMFNILVKIRGMLAFQQETK